MKRLLCKATKYMIPLLLVLCLAGQASTCSLFYFGGDYTDDGANLFFRGAGSVRTGRDHDPGTHADVRGSP